MPAARSIRTLMDLVKELAEKKLADVCAKTVRRHLRKLDYRVIRPVLSINSPDPDYETKLRTWSSARNRLARAK
jgi:hypothetical protein